MIPLYNVVFIQILLAMLHKPSKLIVVELHQLQFRRTNVSDKNVVILTNSFTSIAFERYRAKLIILFHSNMLKP